MAIVDYLLHLDFASTLSLLVVFVLLAHLVPYFVDPHCIRSNGISGPFWARFSDAWLGWTAAQGHRSEVVHELHKKYGTFDALSLYGLIELLTLITRYIRSHRTKPCLH